MTTYAVAIPPSCESERWIELNPAASQAARTVPVTWKRGRPDSSLTTSASCQPRPGGAPSALAIASLAANLAARDWFGRRSEEHPSELQSLMRISYAVFCLTKKHKRAK